MIQNGWRNGIVGVEGPESEVNGPLFNSFQTKIDESNLRSTERGERLRTMNGTSKQMPCFVNRYNSRAEPDRKRTAENMTFRPI